VTMPKMDGIEATRRILAEDPGVRVVGLSMNDDPHTTALMKEAGASTHLSKSVSAQKLMNAIRGIKQI
jgi:DNA-binding NarL/FixJ family response regulator